MSEGYPHTFFAVGERALCAWDSRLREHNLEFCDRLDPEWFMGMVEAQLDGLGESEEIPQSAALAIRFTYHHALETFFGLLLAVYQAPFCIPAWLNLYRTWELRSLIRSIEGGVSTLNAWGRPRPGWDGLSKIVNGGVWDTGEEETIEQFATVWHRLAREFIDQSRQDEYNSIKHGFRAQPGGGAIKIGQEREYGEPPPDSEMKLLGGSSYGSATFVPKPMPDDVRPRKAHHFHLRRSKVLWRPEATIKKVQLLSTSMSNVLAAARVQNGIPGSEVKFYRLEDPDDYSDPWSQTTGVTGYSFAVVEPPSTVQEIEKEDVMEKMREASGL